MEDCTTLLDSLGKKHVTLWVDDTGLRYRAPMGALTGEELAALRRMKREIIEALGQRGGAAAPPEIHQQDSSLAPLTVQQEFLWRRIKEGCWNHLDSFVWRLVGPLNRAAVREGIEALMRRHGALRTRIVEVNGIPKQQIDAPARCDLMAMSCAGMSEAEVAEALLQVLDSDCDLAVGPLFEVRLVELAAQDHLLIWSVHHIVSDGYTIDLIWREFWVAYVALRRGVAVPCKGAAPQYGAYAFWQRSMQQARAAGGDSYWKGRLADAEAIRWNVAEDEIRPRFADWERVPFGRSMSEELRKLASAAGTTLAMVMLSLYAVVIARWCLQRDFVLATTVTGRDRPELEGMAGYCASVMYLRIQLSPGATLSEALTHVSQEFALALSRYDFGEAAANLPHLGARALFQFIPWRSEPEITANSDIKVERYPISRRPVAKEGAFSSYRVVAAFFETGDGILAAGSVARLIADLHHTARQFVQDRHTPVAGP